MASPSSINTSSPTHLAFYTFLFVLTTATIILSCLVQPLFPFQPDSLEWNHTWLMATAIDYYGTCLCLCGIILATEQNLCTGTLWSAGCCLVGSPVCCMWMLVRICRFGVVGLSLRNLNVKKSAIGSKSQDYDDNDGDIEMDDDLKALNELNIDEDFNLLSEEEEEEEDMAQLLDHGGGEQSQQSWSRAARTTIASKAQEAGGALTQAVGSIWEKDEREEGAARLKNEDDKEQNERGVDQSQQASLERKKSFSSSVTEGAAGAAGALSQAMSAMRERGEKIERMDNKAAELESEASNYASFAKQLKEKNKEKASSGGLFSKRRSRKK